MRTPEAWLQEGLLEVLADGAAKSEPEITAALNPPVAAEQVQAALDALTEQGLLRRVPRGDDVHYEVVPTAG